jgi:hypothetical protein
VLRRQPALGFVKFRHPGGRAEEGFQQRGLTVLIQIALRIGDRVAASICPKRVKFCSLPLRVAVTVARFAPDRGSTGTAHWPRRC